MRAIFWIAIIACIVLCVVAWYVAYIIMVVPFALIWHPAMKDVTNGLGRNTTNYFTRGIAIGFWVASIPIPYAYPMYFIDKYLWILFLKADLCVWLLAVIVITIMGIGNEIKPWEDA